MLGSQILKRFFCQHDYVPWPVHRAYWICTKCGKQACGVEVVRASFSHWKANVAERKKRLPKTCECGGRLLLDAMGQTKWHYVCADCGKVTSI